MPYKTTLARYQQFLKTNGLKKQTIKNYLWHVEKFLNWLGTEDLNKIKAEDYRLKLLSSAYSPSTINLHLSSINNYLAYIGKPIKFDFTKNNIAPLDSLTTKQLTRFFEAVPDSSRIKDLRDRALLEILYATGLKVGQIILLKKQHIDDIKQEIMFDVQNHTSIPPLAWSWLKKYLAKRYDNIDYIFVNLDRTNKGKGLFLSIRSVERIVDKYGKKVGVKVTPQILRNTLASNLKKQGATSSELQTSLCFHSKLGAANYLKRL